MVDTGPLQLYGWPCWYFNGSAWVQVNGGSFRGGNVNSFDPAAALDYAGFSASNLKEKLTGFLNLERNIVDPRGGDFTPDWAGCEPFVAKLVNEIRRRTSVPLGLYDVRDYGAAQNWIDYYAVAMNASGSTLTGPLDIFTVLRAVNRIPMVALVTPGIATVGPESYNYFSAAGECALLAAWGAINRNQDGTDWVFRDGARTRFSPTNVIMWQPGEAASLAGFESYWLAKSEALTRSR
jgi:hypothetical protein